MKHRLISLLLKLAGIALCIFFWNERYFWWLMAGYLLLFAAYQYVASACIQLNLHIRSLSRSQKFGILFT
ncbi:MAG: hypothetical protein V4616_11955, partial [Bacteroidota bacterium]